MAMKTVEVKTERVLDDNSNIYLKRAEEKLKNREYDDAISEVKLAIEYSNNNERILEQCDRIKLALVKGNIKKLDFFFENKSHEEIRSILLRTIRPIEAYINSVTFKMKCKFEAHKIGTRYEMVKSGHYYTISGTISDILKIESSISGKDYFQDFFDKIRRNINQYNIEDCKIFIGKYYLVNIKDALFTK